MPSVLPTHHPSFPLIPPIGHSLQEAGLPAVQKRKRNRCGSKRAPLVWLCLLPYHVPGPGLQSPPSFGLDPQGWGLEIREAASVLVARCHSELHSPPLGCGFLDVQTHLSPLQSPSFLPPSWQQLWQGGWALWTWRRSNLPRYTHLPQSSF